MVYGGMVYGSCIVLAGPTGCWCVGMVCGSCIVLAGPTGCWCVGMVYGSCIVLVSVRCPLRPG